MPNIHTYRKCLICNEVYHPLLKRWIDELNFQDFTKNLDQLEIKFTDDYCEEHSTMFSSDRTFLTSDEDYGSGDEPAGSC